MADGVTFTCQDHGLPLLPDPEHPGTLRCPRPGCLSTFAPGPGWPGHVAPGALPLSPLTQLEQGAAAHNELVRSYECAGFSRSEAMQVLCCIISAGIMKGAGNG